MRKIISTKLRWKLYREYNFECPCCGNKNLSELEIDHIIPLANGGDESEYNLQVLCSTCNGSKGKYQYGEYFSYLKKHNPKSLYEFISDKVFSEIDAKFGMENISTIGIKKALEG